MKKIVVGILVGMLCVAAISVNADYQQNFTKKDIQNLQDFLLTKETPDLSDKDYDLNNDNRWDVFDLCLMKREYLSNYDTVTVGTELYRGFLLDNVLHSEKCGDIHYNVYFPVDYDGSEPYALYMTLPGYEGLYFQGVGVNLMAEQFGFEAQKYNDKMIIVAPQLNDWRETSADMTIALTEYFLENYNINPEKVYANGYSGGGETMSLVMEKRPELFTAYLHCSSQWDGDFENLVKSRTPVYIVVGENDEYYGSEPSKNTYNELHDLYLAEGLTEQEIAEILVLDVKPHSYFTKQGMNNEHGGGGLFARDSQIMGWLFEK